MNALSAAELALFERLNGAIAAAVYQDVPAGVGLPFVKLGDMTANRLGGKDDPDRLLTVNIGLVTEGQERKPAIDLAAAIETLLDGFEIDVPDDEDGTSWRLEMSWERTDLAEDDELDAYLGSIDVEVRALR
ncbi:hypothetical protein GGR88_001336 [Sphingomonas jejuensis]|uniref:DUF3168 domain-containing protein n=1 Tax=Sphingomonas jejuensis TaxID=904715 RepID=A0ABX0XLX2_9SPHN|nr:DUF3168 domain-containing protein [Sphingomonas jejuensis]NJC33862.1 hypothetical protein [Sphingomonas jejuensis]